MRWDEFAAACPDLSSLGEERLRGRELCLVGTLRRNGWPRISPVEPEFVDGELMLGMMWRSPKALDLLRDPRLVVHSVVSSRMGNEGDFKLYGRAVPVEEPERRARYRATIKARIDWEPRSRTTTSSPSTSTRPASSPSPRATASASRGIPAAASAAGSSASPSSLQVAAERLLALDRLEEGLEVALAEAW